MATRRAVSNGNWSSTSTWNGGVVPGNGDTVYSNGFNIQLDVDINIGGANNPVVNTGSLVSGQWYEIINVGGQNWTSIGAASNTNGTVFQSSGTGTAGNLGTARALATLTTATNTAAGATIGGGVFTMPAVCAINADLRAGTTTCLNVTATSGTLTLSGLRVVGGSSSGAHGVNTTANSDLASCTFTGGSGGSNSALNNASTGSVNVSASCTFTGGGSGSSAIALNNASTGSVNVSASCTFTGGSTGGSSALNNASTGSVNVSASCTFTGGGGNSAFALNNASTGSVNVSASCTFTGGGGGNSALNNNSTGSVTVTNGTFTASAFTNAVNIANTSADVRLSGDFLDHWSGWKAVSGGKWKLGTAPALGQTRYALAGTTDSYFTMYGADNGAFGNPIAANVRSGVSYGGGNITGTLAVPLPSQVAVGVATDNTVGTAFVTGSDIATAVWGAATRSITGGTVDTLTNAPTVPTPAEIRAEMDSNSTKLANLDATVSSRLATSGYTAPTTPPTAAQIATAVEGSLLNEADGQAVLNAIVGAIGNTNLSEVSLVAAVRADLERTGGKLDNIPTTSAPSASAVAGAVRTELGVELGRIDASVSSRLAPSGTLATVTNLTNAPASVTPSDIWSHASRTLTTSSGPTAAEIRQEMDTSSTKLANLDAAISSRMAASEATKLDAVKAKTDALNTERLANVATTNIVGTLLAQANS